MARKSLLIILLGIILISAPAQSQDNRPLVIFLTGRNISTATFAQASAGGVRKLADIFTQLGARVELLEEQQPIPEDARLVVMARPLEGVNAVQATRLWLHLQRGGHLLIAVDPDEHYIGPANVEHGFANSILGRLILADYGINFGRPFLAMPWYTTESIERLNNTYLDVFPEVIENPITQPLQAYGVPVRLWGARSVETDAFGMYSIAVPLLYTDTAYGEIDREIFLTVRGRRLRPAISELGLDLPRDQLGRFHTAGYAQSAQTGARIFYLGDSEMIQNGYGLAGSLLNPEYPGNLIFTQRMAAWLLEIPFNQWPALPTNFTWLNVDGVDTEWADIARRGIVLEEPVAIEFQRLRSFADDRYVYFSLDTDQPLADEDEVTIAISNTTLVIREDGIQAVIPQAEGDDIIEMIPDAAATFDDMVEIRLPLRYFNPLQVRVDDVCIPAECAGRFFLIPRVGLIAPHDFLLGNRAIGVVTTGLATVNLRSEPNANSQIVGSVVPDTNFSIIGQSADGEWLQVENALFSGWMATFLLTVNGDPAMLPIVDES